MTKAEAIQNIRANWTLYAGVPYPDIETQKRILGETGEYETRRKDV